MNQKIAGHLVKSRIYSGPECIFVDGYLPEDIRGVNRHGDKRDFSNRDIRTSWLESLEYCPNTDTTIITTRNSIYYTTGNLIEQYLDSNMLKISGKKLMYDVFVACNSSEGDD